MRNKTTFFIHFVIALMPWSLKRLCLQYIFGFKLHPLSHIGFSLIVCRHLQMCEGSKISSGVIAVNLDLISLGAFSSIGRRCWITGYSSVMKDSFSHVKNRRSELIVGAHSAITKNHHIDCTDRINVGSYTTIAGYYSQFLTHSIDVGFPRQDASPIEIGDYCFIGTHCVFLPGSVIPTRSVVGANSLINDKFTEECTMIGGVPGKVIKSIDPSLGYFKRDVGYIH